MEVNGNYFYIYSDPFNKIHSDALVHEGSLFSLFVQYFVVGVVHALNFRADSESGLLSADGADVHDSSVLRCNGLVVCGLAGNSCIGRHELQGNGN